MMGKIVIGGLVVLFAIAVIGMCLGYGAPTKKCAKVTKVGQCVGGLGVRCRVEIDGEKHTTVYRVVMVGDEVCWYD